MIGKGRRKQTRKETVAEEVNCGITLLHRALLLVENFPGPEISVGKGACGSSK
jgi:hypothetical protein